LNTIRTAAYERTSRPKTPRANVPNVLYHGTSVPSWERRNPAGTLYLTKDLSDAWEYAYETAAADEENGMTPQPVVMQIASASLLSYPRLELHPDWGWIGANEKTTWQESMKAVGSLSVRGDIEGLKSVFQRGPADPDTK
jgi:hypothetical protein